MSKLFLANSRTNWQLNVTQFSSPIFGEISSAQTKSMAHHYPVRSNQPEVQFSVQFTSEVEFENFQRFVRSHQQETLANATLLWLNWPERNIDNWTGVIRSFRAGGMRRNYAPQASFVVDLVDSMVSRRTMFASPAQLLWRTIYGAGMGPDAVLGLPTDAENSLAQSLTGQDLYGNVVPQAPGANAAQPGFGPTGSLSGAGANAGAGITAGN